MTPAKRHLPQSYALRRAVECYERTGDGYAAAEVLAMGDSSDMTEAARRFAALGDMTAAAEAYLTAGQPRPALDCFRRAGDQEGMVRCLVALGDHAQAGMLLLDLHRPDEALPHLCQALDTISEPLPQTMLGFHLARAYFLRGDDQRAGDAYATAYELLMRLPHAQTNAEAWVALGDWGATVGRQDRMQEGYSHALRCFEQEQQPTRWCEVARRYRDAAYATDNQRLGQVLDMRLRDVVEQTPPPPPPDPIRDQMRNGEWDDAFRLVSLEIDTNDTARRERALLLLAEVMNMSDAPRLYRLRAADLLCQHGDVRLLNPTTGEALSPPSYWCLVETGDFWYGDDRTSTLQQRTMPYDYWIARFPITNADYQHFLDGGGYEQKEWWSISGWQQRLEEDWLAPRYADDAMFNRPNQPVVGISWYEAVAYSRWLTAQGHTMGWLSSDEELRLPTSLEWERAIRHTDTRRYPWGDEEPDPDRANYGDTGLDAPAVVGCFPAGMSQCGALDMAGNVMEYLATSPDAPMAWAPVFEVQPFQAVLCSRGDFRDGPALLACGLRGWCYPASGDGDRGFRLVRAPLSTQ